jgi:dihydroorotate dehydrogenase
VLIAAGGIETPDDAWERLRAGATLVQAYTGFIYGGPLWRRRMHAGLARRARAAGLSSIGTASAGGPRLADLGGRDLGGRDLGGGLDRRGLAQSAKALGAVSLVG